MIEKIEKIKSLENDIDIAYEYVNELINDIKTAEEILLSESKKLREKIKECGKLIDEVKNG